MGNLSWSSPEYIHREKTPDWYWIVVIITISVALVSIILNNLIFAILIIISSFTLSLFAVKKPGIISVKIDNDGININDKHYSYISLDSFWIETRDIYPRIIIKSKKTWMPYVVILIKNIEPEKIHQKLSEHIPEEEHAEPFLEKLLIYLGF